MEKPTRRSIRFDYHRTDGFTLVEILVVLLILGVLTTLLVTSSSQIFQRIAQARCAGNLRSLHVSFGSYINDVGHWPQVPAELDDNEKYDEWWIKTMEPYTASPKVWICPVIEAAGVEYSEGNLVQLHYVPTRFDLNPISPTRWPTQPWLIEIADAHGKGPLILFPDGSVKNMQTVVDSIDQ